MSKSYYSMTGDKPVASAFHPIYRNKDRIDDEGYLTDRLSEEAVAFIDRNKQQPFFLYLAFNAVHTPMHAPPDVLTGLGDEVPFKRRKLVAMTISLDRAVGRVLDTLREHDLERDTLVVYLSDNGWDQAIDADTRLVRKPAGDPASNRLRGWTFCNRRARLRVAGSR